MKISVIVPVYNTAQFLPHCIESILSQSFTDFELLLIDDGSTDGSGKICDAYAEKDNRIRVIHHKSNIGLWAARNTGQDVATGEYLWFPDGDDYFHKDIVKIMYEAINQDLLDGDGKYDLAIVRYKKTDCLNEDVSFEVKPSYINKAIEEIWSLYVHPESSISVRNVWCRLCRRDVVKDICADNYKYAQDCDFSAKLYLKKPRIILLRMFCTIGLLGRIRK